MTALAALAGSQLRTPPNAGPCTQSHEITVPNELIGCIIGKGGTKIAEIRCVRPPPTTAADPDFRLITERSRPTARPRLQQSSGPATGALGLTNSMDRGPNSLY